MTTNIITNNLPWVSNYTTWQWMMALFVVLGFAGLIISLIDFISCLRKRKPLGMPVIEVVCSVAMIVFCVVTMLHSKQTHDQQLKALKTTTFKVASVSRESDGHGDHNSDKFIYHVAGNDLGVKTITSPVDYDRGSADAVASESSVKTMTIKYGKLDQTSDGQKNLYLVVKKTYR